MKMCKTSIFKIVFPCLYNFTLPKYRQDPDPDMDPVKIFQIRLRNRPKRSRSDRIRICNPGTKRIEKQKREEENFRCEEKNRPEGKNMGNRVKQGVKNWVRKETILTNRTKMSTPGKWEKICKIWEKYLQQKGGEVGRYGMF